MASPILTGTAAGAVGTVALNIATYLDMTMRARPASSVPAKLVGVLADKAGVDLANGMGRTRKKRSKIARAGWGH
jgi:hypothetical protein